MSRHAADRIPPNLSLARPLALAYVDAARNHGRGSRPGLVRVCRIDDGPLLSQPPEATFASVTLGNSVYGKQAERSTFAQELERSTEEVGHQVGVLVRRSMDRRK